MNNKKILIFTGHFLPGYRAGGPVTSIANLVTLLNAEFDLTIVTSNHDLGVKTPYEDVAYNKQVTYKNFKIVYLSKIDSTSIQRTINELEPDLIYLNSFFSTFTQLVLFEAFKKNLKTKILLAPRGELQKNALAIKATKKKVYLTLYKLFKLYNKVSFHATDAIEENRINQMFGISNIVTLPNVPKVSNATSLHKNKNELRLIFVSRIRDNKNLLLAIKSLVACKGDIVFDIYGPIEDQPYWEQCQNAMDKLAPNIKTDYKGIVSPKEMTKTMREYHALLLPSKTENFGHVIVEAMQSGVIPIISDQTPWVQLEENSAGWSLDLKNKEAFSQAVETLYAMDDETYSKLSQSTIDYISAKLNIEALKEKYIEIFEKISAKH